MDHTTGQSINNYILQKKLGEGGMGDVYLARHSKVERTVAIKILHQNLFTNETIRNRFKNEANALIKLTHPNIIKIYDYVEQETIACLIMEYFDGITLDDYINKLSGPIPAAKAIRIFGQVLDAVQYAHDRNILHRDIKPGNIMVSRDGNQVRIMDFGIAKLQDAVNLNITHANTQLGTPFYMSPEQVKGLPYTVQSDIYSLGVTLFEMITGKCPYSGITNLFELQSKIVSEPLPATDVYYPNVPAKVQTAIKIATDKTPFQRFINCLEFKKSLEEERKELLVTKAQPLIQAQEKKGTNKTNAEKKSFAIVYLIVFFGLTVIGIIAYSFLRKSGAKISSEDSPTVRIDSPFQKPASDSTVTVLGTSTVSTDRIGLKTDSSLKESDKSIETDRRSREIEKKFSIPGKNEVLRDLKKSAKLNELIIPKTAEISLYFKQKPYYAFVRFDDATNKYLIKASFSKTSSGYRFEDCYLEKTPKPKAQENSSETSDEKVVEDFKNHLSEGKRYCDVTFNDESQLTDIEIVKSSHSGFGDINLDYYLKFRISGKTCSAIVTYSKGKYINTNF